jgi:hypothetical protein
MSTIADKQLLELALTCAAQIDQSGEVFNLLANADAIIEWHERRLDGAKRRDPLKQFAAGNSPY